MGWLALRRKVMIRDLAKVLMACILAASPLFGQAAVRRPRILGISHVAFDVSSVTKARAFYENFLGFQEYGVLRRNNGSIRIVFIKVNNLQHIELFTDKPPAGRSRLNHVAFYTDNASGMRAYLSSRGVNVPEKVGKGKTGDLNFEFKDPGGHTIEMVQYEPGGWVERDRGKFMPSTRISHHIMHAGFLVGSLEKSMQFYGGILGFKEFWQGSANGRTLSWVDMRVPDGKDYVEFMLYRHFPSPEKLGVKNHFCLMVPNVRKAVATLESRPAFKSYGRKIDVKVGVNGKRQANLFDPDGTRIELMEPTTVTGKPAPSSDAPPPRPGDSKLRGSGQSIGGKP